jgi:hypothetical protein
MLHMDLGRPTSLLVRRVNDGAKVTMYYSVEGASWGDGGMHLLDLKNSSKGVWGEDVDLDM